MALSQPIAAVASAADAAIPALKQSAARTERELQRFRDSLSEAIDPRVEAHVAVVLTGSFARAEVTDESDCDFLVLIERADDPLVIPEMIQEMRDLVGEFGFEPPGEQGVFGDFVLTHELVARIGLDADSNTNLTRRMLLLFESVPVYGSAAREGAIELLLRRSCHDYEPAIRTKLAIG